MGYEDGDSINEDFSANGTLEYLELKSDTDESNNFYSINYHLLPNTYTYPHEIYVESLLDHIILSPAAYNFHYESGSIRVPSPEGDGTYGASDHYPVVLDLGF